MTDTPATAIDETEPDGWTEPYDDRPAPPDPADYCGTCGQPRHRCNAWLNGDHNESDLR